MEGYVKDVMYHVVLKVEIRKYGNRENLNKRRNSLMFYPLVDSPCRNYTMNNHDSIISTLA
jgi:hypothetical protein